MLPISAQKPSPKKPSKPNSSIDSSMPSKEVKTKTIKSKTIHTVTSGDQYDDDDLVKQIIAAKEKEAKKASQVEIQVQKAELAKLSTPIPKVLVSRSPVVVIMGHIDHGKSTLLDYIRSTNIVEKEIGGITQRMSAYEVIHNQNGSEKHLTFLDTPGHESFNAMRARGALAADVAILIVSAEDGVKPQTLDAYRAIKSARLPFIVGISKIDKPNASVDRVKLSLAENEIYVEGYGGEIPFVPFSGKTGEGINDLLDMILLSAEIEGFTADMITPAECVVIEANRDKIRGVSATLIIKNGTLKIGDVLVSGLALSTVRILENYIGKPIKEATPSQPVRVVGWSDAPEVGGLCFTFKTKKEAEAFLENEKNRIEEQHKKQHITHPAQTQYNEQGEEIAVVPIMLKGDTNGTLEAVKYEISKIKVERVTFKTVYSGIGDISENDIKIASGKIGTLVLGFNTKIDNSAKSLAVRTGVHIECFDIIYKLTEWLEIKAQEFVPKRHVEVEKGTLKILKLFSSIRDKQVIGGRVEIGTVSLHDEVKIMRRDSEIGKGRIRELQHAKNKVGSVDEGKECGLLVESKIELASGDKLIAFEIIFK